MAAQTVSEDSGSSAIAADNSRINGDTTPENPVLKRLNQELGGRSQEQLEHECRQYIQRSATAALELGKRLLFLREMTRHGGWLETLGRIGIGRRTAQRLVTAAVRFCSLNSNRLAEAAESKSKLFELLVLDDEELSTLDEGGTARSVSAKAIPSMTVKELRQALRKEIPADSPFQPGDRIKSAYAGRLGKVVRTYDDGSACICWDDGEPQPEGLGHERMPRNLLELIEPASTGPVLPPEAEPILAGGSNVEISAHLPELDPASQDEDPEHYPAVYALLPGDFDGQPVSLVQHDGRTWLMVDEVAAILGETPEGVGEVAEIIDSAVHYEPDFPAGSYARVRLASTGLVLRLLDQEAVAYLCGHLDTEIAQRLREWFHGPVETAGAIAENPAGTRTKEQRDMMGTLYTRVEDALGLSLLADYHCASVICDPEDRRLAESALAGALVPLLREARGMLNSLEVSLNF